VMKKKNVKFKSNGKGSSCDVICNSAIHCDIALNTST
jgi:hypothetical protein